MSKSPTTSTPLAASVARELAQQVDHFGLEYLSEGGKLEGILKDLCPDKKRETRLIVLALREKIAQRIEAELGQTPESSLLATCMDILREECGLSDSAARWTVEVWHFALSTGGGDTVALPADRYPEPASAPATLPESNRFTEQPLQEAAQKASSQGRHTSAWGWTLVGAVLVIAALAGGWFALAPMRTSPMSGTLGGYPPTHLEAGQTSTPQRPMGQFLSTGLFVPPPYPGPNVLASHVGDNIRVMGLVERVDKDAPDGVHVFLAKASVVLSFGPDIIAVYGGVDAFADEVAGKFIHVWGLLEKTDAVVSASYIMKIDDKKQILWLKKVPPPPLHLKPPTTIPATSK